MKRVSVTFLAYPHVASIHSFIEAYHSRIAARASSMLAVLLALPLLPLLLLAGEKIEPLAFFAIHLYKNRKVNPAAFANGRRHNDGLPCAVFLYKPETGRFTTDYPTRWH